MGIELLFFNAKKKYQFQVRYLNEVRAKTIYDFKLTSQVVIMY